AGRYRSAAREFGHAVRKVHLRRPLQFLPQPRGIRRDMTYVAEPVLAGDDRLWTLQRIRERACHVAHGARRAGTDVERPHTGEMLLAGRYSRGGDIAHMDEVAPLRTVLEHFRRFTSSQRGCEDRSDPRIGRVARHAGAVDVMIAQCRDRTAGQARPIRRIVLLCDLARGISVARVEWRVLGDECGFESLSAMWTRRFELARRECCFPTRRRHHRAMFRANT